MPKIGSAFIPSSDQLCDRCQSKRKIFKAWREEIKTEYGTTVLNHTEVICTNEDCQTKFEKVMKSEAKKRANIKTAKENSTKLRKKAN